MAGYEDARLVDVDDEESMSPTPKKQARPMRLLGLAVAIVGTFGAIMGTMSVSQPVKSWDKLSIFHKNLLKAFSARKLEDAAQFQGVMEFIFAEADQEDFDKMGIELSIESQEAERRLADSEPEPLVVTMTWLAQSGKGEELKTQFQTIIDAVLEDFPDEAKDNVELTVEDDTVVITITIHPPEEQAEQEEEDAELAFEFKPKFTASLWTGRTLQEMYEHSEDNILTLPKGMKGHVDNTFNSKVFDFVRDLFVEEEEGQFNFFKLMGAISKYRFVEEVRYRTIDELGEAAEGLPSFDEFLEMGNAEAQQDMPRKVRKAMKKLPKFADGLDSVEVTGFPNNYVITAKFTNFHLTELMQSLLM